ncbi:MULTISPECIES: triose-phosphate isomerase family protein [Microbacterium]|uniref:Triosephosphate isomerase n=1 Tax=Microbacterium wangchenii TaxID=2541726 RepID=A0ABX5SS25_9MICO|nr:MULTISPECIES: triose-phosphate isomerase family protein [Microbacterium]MCK6068381.1 triose-phosphate isomerase [Microbacterium sp. EYE_512]QBR87654.1 triosephosphate isomerase [Microbacterium wangchenii]TXK15922.1 triosephosphate isomerase [Microbacterium wangchenii]
MLIGSSLKMYFSHARTLAWVREVAGIVRDHPAVAAGVRPFVLPQFPSIPACAQIGAAAGLAVGAQDLAAEDEGPYTGEVSGAVLAEVGCSLVEVGHAERRRLFGETDEVVAAKLAAALRHGLIPLLCVGEDRPGDAAAAVDACRRQIDSAVGPARAAGLTGPVTIAYEPLWAIGAPDPAGPDHITAVCGALREYGAEGGQAQAVIYGGSARPGMLAEIAGSVDGLFLGRFAHDPRAFGAILDEAADVLRAQAEVPR